MRAPFIVGFGGTTRPGSSGERLVAAVLASCETAGARTTLFGGSELAKLPLYAPDNVTRTEEQRAFLAAVRAADGLVIGTPAYHAGVSGLVKDAIDLLEDTRGDERVYFDGLPVGIVVTAAGWQAGGVTLSALRGIVHAMRGWPTPLAIAVNTVAETVFGEDGYVNAPSARSAIAMQASQIMRIAKVACAEQH